MKGKDPAREPGELRMQAEKMLEGKCRAEAGDEGEAKRLLYELRVYQIELEMQNEELRRAQLELEESRDNYFDLYELAPAGYLTLDRHGLIRRANLTASQLLALEREALLGQPLTRFVAGESRDNYYRQYKKLMKTGGGITFEAGMIRSDGERLWVQLEMAATGAGAAGFMDCRIVIIDITARKEAEEALAAAVEELRQADAQKDDFLGVLSHEIRNPLASIMLSLTLLDRLDPLDERSIKARGIMKRQAAQLSRLVDDMLDVTRIKRNKIELQKEMIALDEILHQTAEDYRAAFNEKGVLLEVQPLPEGLFVHADAARLAQIVGNLLHNSLRFTEPGGFTRLNLAGEGGGRWAKISVADSGIGMSKEMLKTVFLPFRQADVSPAHGTGGLGLGLALVRGLAELHGGEARAHSDGPGKGSLFTVRLPLSAEPRDAASGAGTAVARGGGALRLLVIEDIRDVADSLVALLKEEGHEVEVAYNGPAGIARAKVFHPHVLLCDIGLPGMDGYQVARAFCADPLLKDVYLVSLTGYARPMDIERAGAAGFNQHLGKPANLEQIRMVLARCARSETRQPGTY